MAGGVSFFSIFAFYFLPWLTYFLSTFSHTEPSSVIEIPISMEKDCETELRVKVYFASPG